ncbi:uncharacterized protein N7500_009244 [Penicillium coprophilum]|uniref:uncharacterized protein n=1 Tax=Penicillium coprophilum TaxID=36646 RepID=UPI00239C2AC1|nr:uncharacterized protein N7500_009244 [Penicillium coprophilum]KAJ5153805.1 hypothetical protein N7500_009244 [Penicillium coprophilum]
MTSKVDGRAYPIVPSIRKGLNIVLDATAISLHLFPTPSSLSLFPSSPLPPIVIFTSCMYAPLTTVCSIKSISLRLLLT